MSFGEALNLQARADVYDAPVPLFSTPFNTFAQYPHEVAGTVDGGRRYLTPVLDVGEYASVVTSFTNSGGFDVAVDGCLRIQWEFAQRADDLLSPSPLGVGDELNRAGSSMAATYQDHWGTGLAVAATDHRPVILPYMRLTGDWWLANGVRDLLDDKLLQLNVWGSNRPVQPYPRQDRSLLRMRQNLAAGAVVTAQLPPYAGPARMFLYAGPGYFAAYSLNPNQAWASRGIGQNSLAFRENPPGINTVHYRDIGLPSTRNAVDIFNSTAAPWELNLSIMRTD